MDEEDREEFAKIMVAMAENFNADLSRPGLRLRYESLKQFSVEQIKAAALKVMATRKYSGMPPVAELIEAIPGTQALAVEDKAEIEASKIIEHLNKYGTSKWPDLSDPVTKHLMFNRWPYMLWAASVTTSETVWWRKEFKETYMSYRVKSSVTELIDAPDEVKQLVSDIGGY